MRKTLQELNQKFNKDIEKKKTNRNFGTEEDNELKNSTESFNSTLKQVEDRISELKHHLYMMFYVSLMGTTVKNYTIHT